MAGGRDLAAFSSGVCSGSDVVRIKPFEAVELELGRLWADPVTPLP